MTEKPESLPESPAEISPATPAEKPPRFVALRWRIVLPLFVVVLAVAMIGAYVLASRIGEGVETAQTNILLQSSRAISERAVELYENQRQEAQRVAFTVGVGEAMQARQPETLHEILEGLARLAEIDSIIITDTRGQEIVGLQWVATAEDYAVSADTDLSTTPLIREVLNEGYVGATGLLRTAEGILLYTAVPVEWAGEQVGAALVGQNLDTLLTNLQGSAMADVALYGADGVLLQTTFDTETDPTALTLAPEVFNQALVAVQQIPVQALSIAGTSHQAAYTPFHYGPNPLGVVGTLLPDNVPFTTEIGRQLTALLASALAGVVVVTAFISLTRLSGRVEKVTQAAEALATGQSTTRTAMQPTDEVGAMGQALDQYAEYVQEKQDELRVALRRQRREAAHLLSVLESQPDGVIVQDLDGRVILMNDHARQMIGSQRVFRSAGIHELTAVVTDVLGEAIAPGIYALGDPQRIDLDGKMLSAQAAAVLSASKHRLGTVIMLRDITERVREERSREELLGRLMMDIQQPLSGLARAGARSQTDMVNAFAREVTRHAVGLQKMIVEMRDLTNDSPAAMKHGQRPMRLETLIWAVANEWRQVAQANNLTLHVLIERKGLHILGDERRLRWAIGNIMDNAIKYTPPGGALTLEIQPESETMARLRVRDNGVGIARDELPNIFTRFFRGNPVTKGGRVIHVPGMGQGLTIAHQIIETQGGTINLKSKQHVGTAVYMQLPLTADVSLELPYLDDVDMDGETILLDDLVQIEIE
jgi:PAS domain S-box-containing protein